MSLRISNRSFCKKLQIGFVRVCDAGQCREDNTGSATEDFDDGS